MIALYVCLCGRSLAIASDKLRVPPDVICCDGCGQKVMLTMKRVIKEGRFEPISASPSR